MKNNISIAIILLLIAKGLFAQHTDYIMIPRYDSLLFEKQYDRAFAKLTTELEKDSSATILYNMACYYALKNNKDSAFICLFDFINKFQDVRFVFVDTDFRNLYGDERWKDVKEAIWSSYHTKHPNIKNIEYAKQLYFLGIEDQRYRGYGVVAKNGEIDPNVSSGKDHIKVLKKLIRKYGWPLYSEVDTLPAIAAFFIVQHNQTRYLKRYIKPLGEAAQKGEASYKYWAMMKDRLLRRQGKKQLYGTQYTYKDIKKAYVLFPVEDRANLNNRRKEFGLLPIKEYYRKKNVDILFE